MKKVASVIIVLFFASIAFLLNPVPVLADIGCPNQSASITGSNNALTITVAAANATDYAGQDYDLICLEGTNYSFPGACTTTSSSQVVCTINATDFKFTNCATNPGKEVWFELKHDSDNCLFYLQDTDIAAALAAAGIIPPPSGGGGGVTTPSATCHTEFDAAGSNTGVNTALGCIPSIPQDLVKWILKYAILMGGGIAFILSLWGGITIILAGGNPEKINEGKEIISSAITGILFIAFSVFLLRFIGVDILALPGFIK